jgi:glycerate kinase
MRQAARAGARRIVVAVGGSACTDGGLGAIEVIERLAPFGTGGNAHLVVAVDVWTTFDRAAEVYGPQKGATPEQVGQLKDRLDPSSGYTSRATPSISAKSQEAVRPGAWPAR